MSHLSRPFRQLDVFTDQPYYGNPLAVVLDGTGLSTEAMQHFTDWTNLSECTFVLPPTDEGHAAGADYRVRIFCPGRELPFAGHPTLGTCHAWLQAGGQPRPNVHEKRRPRCPRRPHRGPTRRRRRRHQHRDAIGRRAPHPRRSPADRDRRLTPWRRRQALTTQPQARAFDHATRVDAGQGGRAGTHGGILPDSIAA